MKPSIMLFDEPTSALDPEMVKEVLDVMVGLAESGMTMICVTHEMSFARTVADHDGVHGSRRNRRDGRPRVIFADPQNERTPRLSSARFYVTDRKAAGLAVRYGPFGLSLSAVSVIACPVALISLPAPAVVLQAASVTHDRGERRQE